MIDTKAVKDRRTLRFDSVRQAVAEAERCAAAEAEGRLRRLGNWELGQILGHLAFWASAPFDGYPVLRKPPLPVRVLMPLFKRRFLKRTLPAGFRIPGVEGGTFGIEPRTTEDGLARMRHSFERLGRTDPACRNPVLGPLTHAEWIAINLRHAELHLGFVVPG